MMSAISPLLSVVVSIKKNHSPTSIVVMSVCELIYRSAVWAAFVLACGVEFHFPPPLCCCEYKKKTLVPHWLWWWVFVGLYTAPWYKPPLYWRVVLSFISPLSFVVVSIKKKKNSWWVHFLIMLRHKLIFYIIGKWNFLKKCQIKFVFRSKLDIFVKF